MFNEFKNGEMVFVDGIGEIDEKIYNNIPATIIRRDPYFKDYLVRFRNGTEDWILPKYLRKPYSRKKKKRS